MLYSPRHMFRVPSGGSKERGKGEGESAAVQATFWVLSSRFPIANCLSHYLLCVLRLFNLWLLQSFSPLFSTLRVWLTTTAPPRPYPLPFSSVSYPFGFVQLPTRIRPENFNGFWLKLHLRQRFSFLKVSQHINLTSQRLFINIITTHTHSHAQTHTES